MAQISFARKEDKFIVIYFVCPTMIDQDLFVTIDQSHRAEPLNRAANCAHVAPRLVVFRFVFADVYNFAILSAVVDRPVETDRGYSIPLDPSSLFVFSRTSDEANKAKDP